MKEILGQERWKLGTLAWPDKWPKDCGSDVWDEPDYLGKSQCYDLLWRITLVREPAKDGKDVTLKQSKVATGAVTVVCRKDCMHVQASSQPHATCGVIVPVS